MRCLIVAKFFPPLSNARALQMSKVTDALFAAGCEIEVVAGLENDQSEDNSWPFPVRYVRYDGRKGKTTLPGRLSRLAKRMGEVTLRKDWLATAQRVCLRRVEDFKPDVVLTAALPGISHLVGMYLRRKTNIPWIAFFSDPWPSHLLPFPYHSVPPIHIRIQQRPRCTIKRILQKCDAVLMTNRYGLRLMENGTGVKIKNKAFAIPHVGTITKHSIGPTNRKLVHIGDMTKRLSPSLIEAVKQVVAESPDCFHGLLCIGDANTEYQELVRQMKAEDAIGFQEYVPNSEADAIAASSHALLVIEADIAESPFLPSKFADYSTLGRPILAITPPRGAIRDYLGRHGGGIAVTHNTQEIVEAIRELFTNSAWNHGNFCFPHRLASCFKRENVAIEYQELFRSVRRGK